MDLSPLSYNKINWYKAFVYFFAGFLALHMFSFPFAVYHTLEDKGPTWLGLDVSWQIGLNYQLQQDISWGKDIIFSHGPLGFLVTRNGYGISRWIFLLFDLFMMVNFFFVFKSFIQRASDKFLAVIVSLAAVLLLRPFYGADLSWALLVLVFYWMCTSWLSPKMIHFTMLSVLLVITFYAKLNTGLVALVFYGGHLANMLFFKKIGWKKALLVSGITLGLIIILAFALHVALFDYIRSSLEIIRGYNDIMALEEDHKRTENNLKTLYRILMIVYLGYCIFLIRVKRYGEIFYILFCMAYLFLLKKQAVVRNDLGHLHEFFNCAPLILLCGNLFTIQHFPGWQKVFSNAVMLTTILALLLNTERIPVDEAFKARFNHKKEYLRQFKDFNGIPYLSQKDKRYIPPQTLQKMGNGTVDIFPWDIEYALENKLNYSGRPSFQSYATFTEWLQQRNYRFYEKKAPQFIIYDYDAIDGRYPFTDELPVNLFIAKNYAVADTFTSNERWRLLLQKKNTTVPVGLEFVKKEKAAFNSEIPVDGAQVIKIFPSYNLKGKFRSFRYKPPRLNIHFMKSTGEWVSYRTSVELLNAGTYIEKLVVTTDDFTKLISQKDSLPSITKIKLEADPKYFSSKMKVEYYKLK